MQLKEVRERFLPGSDSPKLMFFYPIRSSLSSATIWKSPQCSLNRSRKVNLMMYTVHCRLRFAQSFRRYWLLASLVGPTVFCGPQNFEPNSGLCHLSVELN